MHDFNGCWVSSFCSTLRRPEPFSLFLISQLHSQMHYTCDTCTDRERDVKNHSPLSIHLINQGPVELHCRKTPGAVIFHDTSCPIHASCSDVLSFCIKTKECEFLHYVSVGQRAHFILTCNRRSCHSLCSGVYVLWMKTPHHISYTCPLPHPSTSAP